MICFRDTRVQSYVYQDFLFLFIKIYLKIGNNVEDEEVGDENMIVDYVMYNF